MGETSQVLEGVQECENSFTHGLEELGKYGDAGKKLADILWEQKMLSEEYLNSLGEDKKLGNWEAKKFIEAGKCDILAKNLDKFECLDKEILYRLWKQGYWRNVVNNLDKFEGLEYKNYNDIAKSLIVGTLVLGHGCASDKILGNFKIHEELMIVTGHESPVKMLVKNLDKFKGLDREVAIGLIEAGYSKAVIENLDKFDGLKLDREIALKMCRYGACEVVFDNLGKFEGVKLDKEIALKMIEKGEPYKSEYMVLSDNIDKFEGLDEEVADKLIEARAGYIVMNHLDKFKGMNYTKLLYKLLRGYFWNSGIVGEGPAQHCRYGNLIVDNLDKFGRLDHKWLVNELVDGGDYYDSKAVAENLNKFDGLDHREIAFKIIRGFGDIVMEYLENFKGVNHKEIVDCLINRGEYLWSIKRYINKIEGLDSETAQRLIEAGYGDVVVERPEKFGLKK